MGKPDVGGHLLWVSRVTFAVLFLLAMMTPAWERGTFALLPILQFSLSGQRFQVGVFALLPVVMAATWAVARLLKRPTYPWREAAAYLVPILLFCALALARIWPVHILHRAIVAVVSVVVTIGAALYVLQDGRERWYLGLLAALLYLQGIVAVAQFLKQGSVGLSWMGEFTLRPNGQGISVVDVAGRRWLRAYGLTSHPNVLGGYLSMSVLACLGAAGSVPRGMRRWLWGAILVGGLGLFLTFSRAAWLGTVCGLLYLAWTTRPWRAVDWRVPQVRRTAFLLAGLLVVSATVLGVVFRGFLVTRFLHLGEPLEAASIRERLEEYQQAWSLIRAVPLKGVGSGYYVDALWAGVGEDRPPAFRKAHSAYLLAAAELGIGGALLWAGAMLAPPVVLTRRAWRTRGTARSSSEGVGWASAFVSAAIVCVFDSYLYIPSTWWPALYLGMLAGAWARAADKRRQGGQAGQPGLKLGRAGNA